MIYGTILCVGDSLTFGSRSEYGQCFPQILTNLIWEKHKQLWLTAVEAVPGETTGDVVKKIVAIVSRYPEAKEMTLLLGTNDAKLDIPVEVFKNNMRTIIGAGIVYGKRVYVMNIPPKIGFGSPGYENTINDNLKAYNQSLSELQSDMKFHLVECPQLSENDLADGIHLKNSGNILIAEKFLEKILSVRG